MKQRGFIIPLIVLFLFILAVLGISYHQYVRSQGGSIFKEAEKMRARNLAQAGFEKALLFIQRKYSFGEYDVQYPSKHVTEGYAKEMEMDFPGVGGYQIAAIRPFRYSDGVFSQVEFNQLPYFKNKKRIGRYDVWEVETLGITNHRVKARLTTLVKVIRQEIIY